MKRYWKCNLLTYLLVLQLCTFSCADDSSFSRVLLKLANEVLGVQEFQDYLDELPEQSPSSLDGGNLVNAIVDDVSQTLEGYTAALRRLRESILRDINAGLTIKEDDMRPCCNYTSSQMAADVRLNTSVDLSKLCRSTTYKPMQPSFIKYTLPTMIDNLKRTPTLKWQYFGSRDGLSIVFPASNRCPDNFDPRLRPWYYSTASGKSKDMLIVIQVSTTMSYTYGGTGTSKLKVAIDTAKFIVESLSPNDRVGVMTFAASLNIGLEKNCYISSLATASPQNKKELVDVLDKIQYYGSQSAHLAPALREAFGRFNGTSDLQPARVRTIFLLTDGRISETPKEILCSVKTLNHALDNSVVIVIFGIDPAMANYVQTFLQNLAEQDFNNADCKDNITSIQPPMPGRFASISDPSTRSILLQIGLYFDAFPNENREDPVFTVPYRDALGLGLISTACLPVISSTQLLGVACVDIPLDLVFNDVINFKLGRLSYAFLIDGHGRALLHPAVPQPETNEAEPVFIEAKSLERSDGSDEIIESMMSGQPGSKLLNANLILNRGSSQLEGVDAFNKWVNFYWNSVPIMNVSVCLAIVVGEVERTRNWMGSYPPVMLADHVNVYNFSNPGLCSQWGKAGLIDQSSVKLAPMSFLDPLNYSLVANTVCPDTMRLHDYLEGKVSTAEPLSVKKGVRSVVALTYKLEEMWKRSDPSHWVYTMYTYIGTEEGLFRKFPGTLMAKEYDPTRRPWYTTAVGSGQIGKVTVSRPYNDSSGGVLLTLCQTIYEGRGGKGIHTADDPVFGVMGLDITLQSFYDLLVAEFTACTKDKNDRCFIIDSSGFIVVHKDYITNGPPPSADHITSREPSIAYDLLTYSVMRNDSCVDFADITTQSFWKISLGEKKVLSLCTVYPVEKSNIFIVVPNQNSPTATTCKCNRPYENGECFENEICQCPCYSSVDYNYCSGSIRTTVVPCLPPTAPLFMTSIEKPAREQGTKLPNCRCIDLPSLFTTSRMCNENKCCWNSKKNVCRAVCSDNPVNPAAIVVPVVLGSLIIVLLVFILCYCWPKLRGKNCKELLFTFCNANSTGRRAESVYSNIDDVVTPPPIVMNQTYLAPSRRSNPTLGREPCMPPPYYSSDISFRRDLPNQGNVSSISTHLSSEIHNNSTHTSPHASLEGLKVDEIKRIPEVANGPNPERNTTSFGIEPGENDGGKLTDGGYIHYPVADSDAHQHPMIKVSPMKREEKDEQRLSIIATLPKEIDDRVIDC